MEYLINRQPDHHRRGTAGKLYRLPHMVDLILAELSINIVDRKKRIGAVPIGLRGILTVIENLLTALNKVHGTGIGHVLIGFQFLVLYVFLA